MNLSKIWAVQKSHCSHNPFNQGWKKLKIRVIRDGVGPNVYSAVRLFGSTRAMAAASRPGEHEARAWRDLPAATKIDGAAAVTHVRPTCCSYCCGVSPHTQILTGNHLPRQARPPGAGAGSGRRRRRRRTTPRCSNRRVTRLRERERGRASFSGFEHPCRTHAIRAADELGNPVAS